MDIKCDTKSRNSVFPSGFSARVVPMDKKTKSSDNISFGEWVRQRRHILDLTQQELADQVGCARITLRRIESGSLKPSKELAQVLLEKLSAPSTEWEIWLQFARGLSEFPGNSVDSLAKKSITNLPAFLTTFIGREKEQDEIINLIAKYRLVTLVGVGGIGKTRLAIQVGQRRLKDYPDGVWFIALDSLSDPALVPQTVAAVFDIQEGFSDQPLLERLTYSLHKKTALLIFDNCEHLLDACAQVINILLRGCLNLRILATSREILDIKGEATYYLSSLSVPKQDIVIKKWTEYESISLFTERAVLAQSSFRLTNENAFFLTQVCHLLDGIPLAIELAAARVDILQVNEILEKLKHCLDLLTSNNRNIPPKHQTMRASMDWSWGLLKESEQVFMRQLSIFAGGWTLDSAQVVCEGNTLELISSLVKKSLIIVSHEVDLETRYHFHEIVLQYGHEKLVEAREEEDTKTRHLKYFLQLSEKGEPGLRGSTQMIWHRRLINERDNIRVALEWANKVDIQAGLLLSGRLERFWESLDYREGAYWLSNFIQKTEAQSYPKACAKALCTYGWISEGLQKIDEVRSAGAECLRLYRDIGDQAGEVDGLLLLAKESLDLTKQLNLTQQAFELAKTLGDQQRQAAALWQLGWSDQINRFTYWEKAIALFRHLEDWRALAGSLSTTGFFLILYGDIEAAQKHIDEGETLYHQLKIDKPPDGLLAAQGQMALMQGNFKRARSYVEEEIRLCREYGIRQSYVWARARLGNVALREGKLEEASLLFKEAIQSFQGDKNEIGVVVTLEGIAGLFLTISKHEYAARLIGWADATRKEIGDTRPLLGQAEVDKIIAACVAKMGEVAFSEAYEEGQKMSIDEAIAYTLKPADEM
jgi:predicted ATPase/DNA-binding XRE family transcriptional regulator